MRAGQDDGSSDSNPRKPDADKAHDPHQWLRAALAESTPKAPQAARISPYLYAAPICLLILCAIVAALYWRDAAKPAPQNPPPAAERRDGPLIKRVFAIDRPADLAKALRASGVDAGEAERAAAAAAGYFGSGERLLLQLTLHAAGGRSVLVALNAQRLDGSGVALQMEAGALRARAIARATTTGIAVIRGQMNGESFYTSAVSSGIDDGLIGEITAALSFDFDFAREIHAGDQFEVAVEATTNARGESIGRAKLLYISLTTAAKTVRIYRFGGAGASPTGWYDGNGLSVRKGLMRTPVDGARVTSAFGMRMHPILGFMRMHKGVDFGTPVGTPVYASGDGTVSAVGVRGGYGLYLRIEHSATLATAYGHLSKIADGVKAGSLVRQSQIVAYSGNSGDLSTGPHLHYEVLVDGQQVDPFNYRAEQSARLDGGDLPAFQRERNRIDLLLANAP